MKTILGLAMIVGGLVFGLYMGIWWAFIGGIVQVMQEIRAEHLSEINVAIGVAKVTFSALIGWISAILLILPGLVLLEFKL